MHLLWHRLKSGDWLTPARIRAYSLIVLAIGLAAAVVWIGLSEGGVDRNGKPLGTDFSSFYAAGSMALEGHAAAAYDFALHHVREQQVFGAATPYYAWLYPPIFFLIAAPLAWLPYPAALAVWQFGSLALYLAVIGAILRGVRTDPAVRHNWLLVAAAFPAVFINLGHGQNGFLSAALFGAALLALPARPLLAGILFAALAYKPQFGIAIPFALIAAGRWRTIGAACLTLAILIAITAFLFGIESWSAFLASAGVSRKILLEGGAVGFEKLQSAFAVVRLWGGGVTLAYAVQALISCAVIASIVWCWRSACDEAHKAALLVAGTLLASPHILDYDLIVLAVAIAFLAAHGLRDGFRPFEITLLGALWIVPLLARSMAGVLALPLGFLVIATFYMTILMQARRDAASLRHTDFAKT
jgi:alpha-1,2-mannosyltransferase